MDTDSAPPTTIVPVKIPAPPEHAPPTLAEPASGPAAEMSGALHGNDKPVPELTEAVNAATTTLNGNVQSSSASAETPLKAPAPVGEESAQPAAASQDVEMKDDAAPAPAVSTQEPAAEANGTPASKQNNGKRKSIGGVPEHKNKKLNKKKSMPKITHLDAKPGEFYYARLKSYPPWPSIICDESMLPQSLLTTRPITTKQADGTYKEAYDDGGKKVMDRTYPIMFLHTNEFAWIPNTDLAPLNPTEMGEVTEKGKSKMLIAAHKVAAENHNLQYFKDMLVAHAEAIQADDDAQAEREAAKAAKADKKKRKSEASAEDVNIDDVGGDGKKSKKRKKAAESDEEEKPAKTPKTTKLKLTSPKDPATAEKKKEKKEAKPKAEKRKSRAAVSEDDEMPDAEEKEPEKPLDPAQERKDREKEVLFLRHKLQKGFLSRDQAPQEEEMPQMSSYIKKLEAYGDLEVGIIKTTKINKVLKALIKLNSIPKDEEFKFRERSMDMLTKWNKLLGNEFNDADEKKSTPTGAATPTTNGVHKDEKQDKPEITAAPVETPAVDTAAQAEPVKQQEASTEVKETAPAPVEPELAQPAAEEVKGPADDATLATESAPGAGDAANSL